MRKFLLTLIAILTLSFTACGNLSDDNISDDGKLNIVTTIFPPYDFVREIAGENVNLISLLSVGSESHSYEPTPQDIITIENADLFIYNGGESDVWVDKILKSVSNDKLQILKMMDCVENLEEEYTEGMQSDEHEHETHEHEIELDEHIWTSPKNAAIIANSIYNNIIKLDRENEKIYTERYNKYKNELSSLGDDFADVIKNSPKDALVFGDRFPFRYLAADYNLRYFAAFPGCSDETEASAHTLAFLIDKVSEENIPVVFHVELSTEKIADTICSATGAEKMLLHSCHNLTRAELESGATYISLMRENLAAIKTALS